MTINNSSRTAGPYYGNGSTKDFPFAFKVFSRADLLVAMTDEATQVETILTLDSDYSVALNPDQNSNAGGVISLTTPLPVGMSLAATSNIPITQNLDLTNQGGFYPKVINDALDRIVMQVQQIGARVGLGMNVGASAALDAMLKFRDTLASSAGAGQVSTSYGQDGAVTQTLQDIFRERLTVTKFGIRPGVAFTASNCDGYAKLAKYVNQRGGNVEIVWPPAADKYYFSPRTNANYKNSTTFAWRGAIELVDVKNVYHIIAGATIHLDADPTWIRANPLPVNSTVDESVFQFRSSVAGGCSYVGVIGPGSITTNDTLDSAADSDGTTMGVAFRACTNTVLANVTAEYWGTDSFYYGSSYGNTFGGENHILINPVSNRAHRQGISIVRNSHGRIFGGYLHDTYGGTFGHGIDWEPDGGNTQEDWTVVGLRTSNNQRGAFNFINTRRVRFIGVDCDEQHAETAGTIYIDGSNVVGFDVEEISFIASRLVGLQPVVYVTGGPTVAGGIDKIRFTNCEVGTLSNTPLTGAWLRVNPDGYSTRRIGTFTFDGCRIVGNGGLVMRGDGTNQARLQLINRCKWYLTNPNGTALSVSWSCGGTFVDLDGVDMSIDPSKTLVTQSPYIQTGRLQNCRLQGHAAAKLEWVDYGAGRTAFEIGWNEFSTYSYYKGVASVLTLPIPGAVQTKGTGDFGATFRVLHGGRQRVIAYTNTPSAFVDGQAPRDGDITYNAGNAAASSAVVGYIFDGNLNAWRQHSHIVKKGLSTGRPIISGTELADVGVTYLDTTLSPNGKPVFWNGSAWVDATGAVV